MPIYMLNLLFDPTNNTEQTDGRFMEYDPTQPLLLQSKIWLSNLNPNPQPPPFNPSDWQRLQQDTSLLSLAPNDQVYIRICSPSSVASYVGKLTTMLTRDAKRASQNPNSKPYQTRGSPFPLTAGSTQSAVIFHMANWTQPYSDSSWVQGPWTVTLTTPPPNPKPPGFHDSYKVIVGVTTGPGNPTQGPTGAFFIYSHDPDMDVSI